MVTKHRHAQLLVIKSKLDFTNYRILETDRVIFEGAENAMDWVYGKDATLWLMAQRKANLRYGKTVIEKKHAGKRVKSDAHDRVVWRLGCENRSTTDHWKIKLGSRRTKIFVNTPQQMDDVINKILY